MSTRIQQSSASALLELRLNLCAGCQLKPYQLESRQRAPRKGSYEPLQFLPCLCKVLSAPIIRQNSAGLRIPRKHPTPRIPPSATTLSLPSILTPSRTWNLPATDRPQSQGEQNNKCHRNHPRTHTKDLQSRLYIFMLGVVDFKLVQRSFRHTRCRRVVPFVAFAVESSRRTCVWILKAGCAVRAGRVEDTEPIPLLS